MALRIDYRFKGEARTLRFAHDRFHDHFAALADAEGIDLTQFLAMERQLKSMTRDKQTLHNYRDNEFAKFGFSHIVITRE